MTTYTYKCTSTWTVSFRFNTKFDISDQSAWAELRDEAQEFYNYDDFSKRFPKKAPSDPGLWLELFQIRDYNTGDVGASDEGDWDSDNRKFEGEIISKSGKVVANTD